jgi:hypothetical protein
MSLWLGTAAIAKILTHLGLWPAHAPCPPEDAAAPPHRSLHGVPGLPGAPKRSAPVPPFPSGTSCYAPRPLPLGRILLDNLPWRPTSSLPTAPRVPEDPTRAGPERGAPRKQIPISHAKVDTLFEGTFQIQKLIIASLELGIRAIA